MATRKHTDNENPNHVDHRVEEEDDDNPRIKISITVPREVLERLDTYRKRRGGLNRSALFSLSADWFMDEHPLKKY